MSDFMTFLIAALFIMGWFSFVYFTALLASLGWKHGHEDKR